MSRCVVKWLFMLWWYQHISATYQGVILIAWLLQRIPISVVISSGSGHYVVGTLAYLWIVRPHDLNWRVKEISTAYWQYQSDMRRICNSLTQKIANWFRASAWTAVLYIWYTFRMQAVFFLIILWYENKASFVFLTISVLGWKGNRSGCKFVVFVSADGLLACFTCCSWRVNDSLYAHCNKAGCMVKLHGMPRKLKQKLTMRIAFPHGAFFRIREWHAFILNYWVYTLGGFYNPVSFWASVQLISQFTVYVISLLYRPACINGCEHDNVSSCGPLEVLTCCKRIKFLGYEC